MYMLLNCTGRQNTGNDKDTCSRYIQQRHTIGCHASMLLQVMTHKFYVHNVGDLPVSLTWKMPSLFSVQPPACDDLQPGQTSGFEASFTPTEAAVFTGSAICSLSTGSNSIMRVTAIGKYPYLSVEPSQVDHGQVLVGASVSSSVKMLNQSLVPANFVVSDDLPNDDQVFRLSPVSGCIPPGKGVDLKLVYNPRFPGAASSVHYTIKTPGGNSAILKQSGAALGATVALTDSSLGFGDIPVGHSMRKVQQPLRLHVPPGMSVRCTTEWIISCVCTYAPP